MLSITEMMFLTPQEKAQYVWNNGKYCHSRWENNHRITSYRMGNFYAEIWYNHKAHQVREVILKEAFYKD